MERPKCKCHAKLMHFNKTHSRKDGVLVDYWTCAVQNCVRDKVRNNSPKRAIVRQRADARYSASAKGYATRRRRDLRALRSKYTEQLHHILKEIADAQS